MDTRQWIKRRILAIGVLVLMATTPALAAEAQEILTLQQVLDMAVRNNPAVMESQKRW